MKRVKELINRPKSFILVCSIYFVIYSILSVLVLLLFENLATQIYLNMYPETFFPEDHMEELCAEHYEEIHMDQYQGSDYVVLDSNYNVIYTTDEALSSGFESADKADTYYGFGSEDIELLAEADTYYTFYRFNETDGSSYIMIMKCTYTDADYEEESDVWEDYVYSDCTEYCLLDENLNIVAGTLFAPRTSVTTQQLNLLNGVYDADRSVYRMDYFNDYGEARIILRFQDDSIYDDIPYYVYDNLEHLRYISVPIIIGLMICFSVLIIHKLRKSLTPLNQAIIAYSKGERIIVEESRLPTEFHSVVENLDSLLDQLEESRAETERINAEKQRIISNLSHDLKTPLTVVQGYSLALSDGLIEEEKKQQYYQVIYDRTIAMGELLNALLKYTRLEMPEYEVTPERIDFIEMCRRYLSAKYQELELDAFHLDIDLPEQAVMMDIDRKLMRRAFDNLIGNALKYNPPGTTITVRVEDDKDAIIIVVADDGVGIPPEIGQRAFEPMVSGDTARTGGAFGEGSGIGLSIVRRVVELHHGSVSLNDPLEKGFATQFTIRLPKPTE